MSSAKVSPVTADRYNVLAILGIRSWEYCPEWLNYNEIQRRDLVRHYLSQMNEPYKEEVLANVCHFWLHEIIKRFLNPPHLEGLTAEEKQKCMLDNGYLIFLADVVHHPVFIRCIHADLFPVNFEFLTKVVVRRLLVVAPAWDRAFRAALPPCNPCNSICTHRVPKDVLSVLLTFLLVYGKYSREDGLPPSLRVPLHYWVSRWAHQHPHTCVGPLAALIAEELKQDTHSTPTELPQEALQWLGSRIRAERRSRRGL